MCSSDLQHFDRASVDALNQRGADIAIGMVRTEGFSRSPAHRLRPKRHGHAGLSLVWRNGAHERFAVRTDDNIVQWEAVRAIRTGNHLMRQVDFCIIWTPALMKQGVCVKAVNPKYGRPKNKSTWHRHMRETSDRNSLFASCLITSHYADESLLC